MLLARFLDYVKFNTASNAASSLVPSTVSQIEFLKKLSKELFDIGLSDLKIVNNTVLFATLEATDGRENEPVIGLLAHVDTSPDASSENIIPRVHENYQGGDIALPNGLISFKRYPEMVDFIGHTIITSDGATLLGADDKAGVAILISLADYLLNNNCSHPKLRLAFTTDEEIGTSIDNFDVKEFGVDYAYTLDAGGSDLLEYENFNAASAIVTVSGQNIHPGYGYRLMINACDIANEFHSMLPALQRSATTKDREGFYHLHDMCGSVEKARLHYIIRDFDTEEFNKKKNKLGYLADQMNEKYPNALSIEVTDTYFNMRNFIPDHVIERARSAYSLVGVVPSELPIRGGTDGARLSQLGIPTPNLFNGGMNFHSKDEYCSLNVMQKALEMVIQLVHI